MLGYRPHKVWASRWRCECGQYLLFPFSFEVNAYVTDDGRVGGLKLDTRYGFFPLGLWVQAVDTLSVRSNLLPLVSPNVRKVGQCQDLGMTILSRKCRPLVVANALSREPSLHLALSLCCLFSSANHPTDHYSGPAAEGCLCCPASP